MLFEEDTTGAVQKAPSNSGAGATAPVSQLNPDSKKKTHEELRKEGLTASSGVLPKLEIFFEMVRNSSGLFLNTLTGKDGLKPGENLAKPCIQGPAEPTTAANFYPKNGIYNPAAPPGVGDTKPGQAFNEELDTGNGNIALAWRQAPSRDNADGTITHEYKGSLQDTGLMPWEKDNTNFSGNEKWSKGGSLLERSVRYSSGLNIKFATNKGPQEIQGVHQIDVAYNPKSRNYDTVITTADGRKCSAETGIDGQIKSFKVIETPIETKDSQTPHTGRFVASEPSNPQLRPAGEPSRSADLARTEGNFAKPPDTVKTIGELAKNPELMQTVGDLAKNTQLLKTVSDLAKNPELLKTVGDLASNRELLKSVGDLAENPELLKAIGALAKHPELLKTLGTFMKSAN